MMMCKYIAKLNIVRGFRWVLLLGVLPVLPVAADTQVLHQLEMFNSGVGVKLPAPKEPSESRPLTPKVSKDSVTKSLRSSQQGNNQQTTESDIAAKPTEEVKSDDEIIRDKAFKQVKDKLFPLTNDQIANLHRVQENNERALQAPATTPPRPAVTTQVVRLDPGSTPSVIRIGRGFISSVVFLDSTGAPWPIVAYDLGDPSAFNIQWDKSGANALMIQSKKLYTYGNMAVKLQGMNTPVMLTLVPGQQVIDYRVDMRVMGLGPNAEDMPVGLDLPAVENSELMRLLDGVKPPKAKRLDVVGGPASAWLDGDAMYVRTRLTILSPGWLSMLSSADGMKAYKLIRAPVLLVSWHGKVMQLKIEGLTHD